MPLFQRSLRPRKAPADAPTSWLGRLGWLPWVALALGLEAYGRWSPSDGWDLLGAMAVIAAGTSAWGRFNHRLLRWWHLQGSGRWERFAAPWRVVYGFDLRGWPPLPEAVPLRWALALGGLSACGVLLLLGSDLWPGAWRAGLQQVSGLLLLAWTAVMGAAVLALGGFSALGAYQFAKERWRGGDGEGGRVSRGLLPLRAALALGAVAWATAAWVLPPWFALVLLLGVALTNVWTTSLLGRDLRLIWRTGTDLDRGPRWGRFSTWESGWVLAIVLVVVAVGVLSHGDRWRAAASDDTRWLSTAGIAATWLAAGTLGVTLLRHQLEVLVSRWHDPARPCLPRVTLVGQAPRAVRQRLGATFRRVGFRFHSAASARPEDVPLELVHHREPTDPWLPEVWPKPITFGEAGDAQLHNNLRRRSATLQRRALRRGLEVLFAAAEEQEFEQGSGFWLAPHLWFVFAMSRDEDEEGELATRVGPPYRQAFPRSARAHLHRVLTDLDLDLIFVEDGVKGPDVQLVFDELFEIHDLFGPHRLDETRRFGAIPGVRVMIHDFELDTPLLRPDYPEPDYDGLGRARLLHVFRDRGGEDERVSAPNVGGLVTSWI